MDGKKLEYKGDEALNELERLTSKAGEVQHEILGKILEQNCDTEYLKKYLGNSSKLAKSVLHFKNRVPAISYKDIRPYIVRIANGEDSTLITGRPIIEMLCSSGTSSGEPKLMPSIAEDLDRRTFLYNLIMPIVNHINLTTQTDEVEEARSSCHAKLHAQSDLTMAKSCATKARIDPAQPKYSSWKDALLSAA